MIDNDDAHLLWHYLCQNGAAALPSVGGKRLFLVHGRMFGLDGLLISFEDQGTMFWDMERPLNAFRLINSRFGIGVAETIANIGNALANAKRKNTVPLLTNGDHDD